MNKLYHYWFCPFSRATRVALMEWDVEFDPVLEMPWARRHDFLALNPAGTVPVLVTEDGLALSGSYAIREYMAETRPDSSLLGDSPAARAEIRRLIDWFDVKFNEEVTALLITEKVMKRFLKLGEPQAENIRCASTNLKQHLKYIEYLAERRNWLGGDEISHADIAAAAHLSCIDYLGDVPWENYQGAKDWYARIKSRPSFRPLLKDLIAGLPPVAHYKNLDF
ncbi:Glutathione S-transferase family protein [hydrothermal vent metagenome]|uniref:Glutathione S-transferase family protein n=1 Tax=hydrothermal vent metagenome TaxID=652676 RepID=A0A3B0RH99_9ZZZZ